MLRIPRNVRHHQNRESAPTRYRTRTVKVYGNQSIGCARGGVILITFSLSPRSFNDRVVFYGYLAFYIRTRCEQYAEALQRCVTRGLTAVHTNDENAVQVYARLQEEDRLPVRVYLTMPHDELDKEHPAARKIGSGATTGGVDDAGKPKPWSGDKGLLSWNRVKLFSDGSLGACATSARSGSVPHILSTKAGHI